MAFRRILFPVDFSEAAKAMAPTVIAFAQRFQASVTALNAFDLLHNYHVAPPLSEGGKFEPAEIPYTAAARALRDERQGQLEEFTRNRFSGVKWTARIEDGDPASVIKWVAEDEQSDLIMMPTRGLGRFRQLLLGSVTAKVIHDVDLPVFTTAHEPVATSTAPGRLRSILCATRFDPESETALKMTRFLADSYGARVCLLYIHSSSAARPPETVEQFIRHAFGARVNADGESTDPPCVRVLDAAIPEGIRQTAVEQDADLVVVGRGHFRGDISWAWSHLYSIIRESPCPVLTV